MKGGAGSDLMYGGDGDDQMYGGDGADSLFGEVGVDTLYDKDDASSSDSYADYLDGGANNDVLGKSGTGDTVVSIP